MGNYKPRKTKPRGGLEASLLKLGEIDGLPPEIIERVKQTAETVGNTMVFSYSLNVPIKTFESYMLAYRMKFEKLIGPLCAGIENACLLHSPELEISASHMEKELVRIKLLKNGESLLGADPEVLETARKYVQLASVWRANGGRSTWNGMDRETLRMILEAHGHELPRALDAIRATRSISAPFVAAMDSLATPLAQGAL